MKIDVVFIIVIVIVGLLTVRGAYRGLRGIIFGVLAWIFTLGFVSWMTPTIEEHLNAGSYRTWVYEHVEVHIEDKAEAEIEEQDDGLEHLVDGLEIPLVQDLMKAVQESTMEKVDEAKQALVAAVSEELTNRIVNATAMIIAILMAVAICGVVSLMLKVIHELPIVGGISRLIGGVWGFAEGILVVWVLFILTTSMSVSELGQKVMISIANNPILLYLYQNNLILDLVNQIRNAIGA